jgi:hypothetical protein
VLSAAISPVGRLPNLCRLGFRDNIHALEEGIEWNTVDAVEPSPHLFGLAANAGAQFIRAQDGGRLDESPEPYLLLHCFPQPLREGLCYFASWFSLLARMVRLGPRNVNSVLSGTCQSHGVDDCAFALQRAPFLRCAMKLATWVRPTQFEPRPAEPEPASKRTRIARLKQIPPADVPNPYRPGTMKHDAFELYKRGGLRGEIVAAIESLGATLASAHTWVYYFGRYVRTGNRLVEQNHK